ncbi:hypothetical protein ONS95_011654 [Cadophora gregata]|uniref:uncharacterized protein n=1 Tax=Cadophora gregata TaxID=51156 RepID=UPI0026DDA05B|nr:uncharacterized protein ONS95_011654 [Cadophora gregata]KAK0120248.1 hypothetical protein ONS95_011654 [Cadophora gregata]KAK0121284.1 hypothetical protein ONS96_011458 [Cadophora gregata f. sp. sojae]
MSHPSSRSSSSSASTNKAQKRLIVSCDGTWQSADNSSPLDNTNAINFCRALKHNRGEDEKEQIMFYQAGVGSDALTKSQKLLSGGFGLGLEENSREAYSYLAYNYRPGDEIFLIGFSRGAYTARSVAGLIGALGMLSRDGMQYFKAVYALYKAAKTTAGFTKALERFIEEEKLEGTEWRIPPSEVEIKAVACWETVGALGVPENWVTRMVGEDEKWKFLDTQLPERVEFAFQALGLDEHRSSFSPTLWWRDPNAQFTRSTDGSTIQPTLIQTWFPGHHSDVGGGQPDHKISNITLVWMIDQFTSRCLLDFDIDYVKRICSPSRNTADPSWTKNKDPFYSGFLPTLLWSFLGSKIRTPGRYKRPEGAKGVSVGSRTNENMHYSVRAKMEESAKVGDKRPLSPPSRALEGYVYDGERRSWVCGKKGRPELTEVELPRTGLSAEGVKSESLEAWIFSEWLQKQAKGN